MDIAFGILCIVLFLLLVFRPVLQRWLQPLIHRWAMGKMEDQMRRMAGMPTRKEERKARKRREAAGRTAGNPWRSARRRTVRSTVGMLRYIAEDVEFTEIKDYSPDLPIGSGQDKRKEVRYKVEEQIEDVEYKEIKNG